MMCTSRHAITPSPNLWRNSIASIRRAGGLAFSASHTKRHKVAMKPPSLMLLVDGSQLSSRSLSCRSTTAHSFLTSSVGMSASPLTFNEFFLLLLRLLPQPNAGPGRIEQNGHRSELAEGLALDFDLRAESSCLGGGGPHIHDADICEPLRADPRGPASDTAERLSTGSDY